ncbi:hypothetical protein FHS54_001148 [Sphingobium vermicomposti]|uniref:Uncharacterized protein n=1 Tax=Sphingobium vermicomposti TaxID=529005 RepID=A0A846M2M8_9SPHN|nr:hypothetical protein [Sphingobium vermicomposti]
MAWVGLYPCQKFSFILRRGFALNPSQQARGFRLYLAPASAA